MLDKIAGQLESEIRLGGELIDVLGYRWLFPVASVAQLVGVAQLQSVSPQRDG